MVYLQVMLTLYTVFTIYLLVELIRVIPPVEKLVQKGMKPFACHPCMAFWIGAVVVPVAAYTWPRHGIDVFSMMGMTLLLLRISHGLRVWAGGLEWRELPRGVVDEGEPEGHKPGVGALTASGGSPKNGAHETEAARSEEYVSRR